MDKPFVSHYYTLDMVVKQPDAMSILARAYYLLAPIAKETGLTKLNIHVGAHSTVCVDVVERLEGGLLAHLLGEKDEISLDFEFCDDIENRVHEALAKLEDEYEDTIGHKYAIVVTLTSDSYFRHLNWVQ